jgi:nitrate/nitrite sensing protein/histidine kinase/DNA gyrase B/HSP90-like ATPase/HAMP domain-containing protein
MDTTSPPASDTGRSIGLRNWRVRSKLIAVLVIPAIAFVVVAGIGIGSLVRNAQAFEDGRRLAELGRQVTALVHELQTERDLSVAFTATADKGVGNALGQQQPQVDQAAAAYREAEAPLYDDLGERLQGRFDAVRAGLDSLAALREAARASSLTGRATAAEYSQIIDQLLDVNAEIAAPGGNDNLAQSVRAFNDLSRAKEVTSQVRGVLYALSFQKNFEFGGFQDYSGLLARQQATFQAFQADANDQQRGLFASVVKGQAVLQVDRIQQEAIRSQSGENIDGPQWLAASTTNMELLRNVESRFLNDVIVQSGQLSSNAQRDALRNALLIALILGIALLALLVVARSMAQPLQQLRAGAIDIAQHRLPDAVDRIRTTERDDLDVHVEPIGIRSKDEIGQVAQAVDDIQQVAVRLATEQAGLRRSIGDMFTNLARRSQTLIDRQLELIDQLERDETDPDALEHLFRLDHLATRMRRNAEDLIVLSGADPGRHWVQPMTVVDVVRNAAAEVEEYQRVELLPLDDLEVAGHVAVDVIHLLAELIENATAFSPPNTKVQVAGQWVPHGYVIEIEDRGLGMSDEELIQANERLANPPEIDFALSRVLGLYVVGKLGQRHGIKVQLRHSWYGGVTALTLIPKALLIRPDLPQAIPDTIRAAVPGLAQLPPPDRGAVQQPGPAPAPAPVAHPGDRLPIFEAARSDWFVAEPAEAPPPRLHRGLAPEPDGNGVGRGERPVSRPAGPPPPSVPLAEDPGDRPGRVPPVTPSLPPQATPPAAEEPVLYRAEPAHAADELPPLLRAERLRRREAQPGPAAAEPPTAAAAPPPPAAAPDPGPRVTQAGLPRRVPRANLAPEMVATQQAEPEPPPSPPSGRSPDEVRSMLSSYRTGIERGRTVAGGPDPGERPPEGP